MVNASTIKSIQDIMRKDVGVDGDAQRLGQLVWMIFLKIFDDREYEWEALDPEYASPIPAKYRWREWAASDEGLTGDDLLEFVNDGLFPELKALSQAASDERASVVRSVFEDAFNYMKSGTLLRQVVNKIESALDFNKREDRHVFGDLYEQFLRDLQSAGNAGEYYTPRALTRLMVEMVDPKLGEEVLDPACGTGGFLTCALDHIRASNVTTGEDEERLQHSLHGVEKKPLPYALCTTNMMLHGIDVPTNIVRGNTLERPLRDYGPDDRVDVVVTNPPFGGIEEDGIEGNFPSETRTAETALLFLQLIMRRLRRGQTPGRAAVIVPNGTLYEDGVAQKVRRLLLTEFNLHTVVRLPKGVFEPYTDIATNLLFFDASEPTKAVWFYEHPLPAHRAHLKGKSYSASDGIKYDEFGAMQRWWHDRTANDHAWRMSYEELADIGFDLAQNHPDRAHVSLPTPDEIIRSIRQVKDESERTLRSLETTLSGLSGVASPKVPLSELLVRRSETLSIQDDVEYTRARVQLHFRGAVIRDTAFGAEIGSKSQKVMRANDLIVSRIDARNGAMALVPEELDGAIATNDFPVFEIRTDRIRSAYLRYCLFQLSMLRVYEGLSRGSTNRRRLKVEEFLALEIGVPNDLDAQLLVADMLHETEQRVKQLKEQFGGMEEALDDLVGAALHLVFRDAQ